jgi:hypothetical protein
VTQQRQQQQQHTVVVVHGGMPALWGNPVVSTASGRAAGLYCPVSRARAIVCWLSSTHVSQLNRGAVAFLLALSIYGAAGGTLGVGGSGVLVDMDESVCGVFLDSYILPSMCALARQHFTACMVCQQRMCSYGPRNSRFMPCACSCLSEPCVPQVVC